MTVLFIVINMPGNIVAPSYFFWLIFTHHSWIYFCSEGVGRASHRLPIAEILVHITVKEFSELLNMQINKLIFLRMTSLALL
ncbi:hypothetical protein ACSC85_005188, partial [Escherichia coli]